MESQVRKDNRAVVISFDMGGSSYRARLYVNCRNGMADASATLTARKFKTFAGAQKWANEVLA